jgi:hypothetical protein
MEQLHKSTHSSRATESESLRVARYVNVGVWFCLLATDVLNPVVTNGNF